MKFEAGKEYRTRDGGRARVYATDGGGGYPIHGALWVESTGLWEILHWRAGGNRHGLTPGGLDLMPPAEELWAIYGNGGRTILWTCQTKSDAEARRSGREGYTIKHFREVTE